LENELKRIKTKILSDKLPIWEDYSPFQEHMPDERLDNNYFSVAYDKALEALETLDSNKYSIHMIGEIMQDRFTGLSPQKDGDTPLIEKTNVMSNVILPIFEKFATVENGKEKFIIEKDDLLLSKDGSPGVASAISEGLLNILRDEFGIEKVAIATHVYKIQLKEEYKKYAPFIGAFMNSKLGQALVRRFISGSVSPTIRRDDVDKIIIVIPKENNLVNETRLKLAELQRQAIAYSRYVQYSNELVAKMFDKTPEIPKLPINWMPGGKRDPHGYDKE